VQLSRNTYVLMYTENMHIVATPRRGVFIVPVMKQNICGRKFEDGC